MRHRRALGAVVIVPALLEKGCFRSRHGRGDAGRSSHSGPALLDRGSSSPEPTPPHWRELLEALAALFFAQLFHRGSAIQTWMNRRPCWRAGATYQRSAHRMHRCSAAFGVPVPPHLYKHLPRTGADARGICPHGSPRSPRLVRGIDATRAAESWKQLLLRCKSFPRNLHPHLQRCKSRSAHPNTAVALFARASPELCTYICNAARATTHIRKQLLLRCRSFPRTLHLHLQRCKSRRTHVETAVAPLQQCSQKFRGASCELSGPEAGLTRTGCVKPKS